MKTITITVDQDGNAKIEGDGFKGRECDEKMKAFEQEMGSVKKQQLKPEYHQTNNTTVKQTV